MVLAKLAEFVGIDYDPKPYQGNYSFTNPAPREIPTDSQIFEFWKSIDSLNWKWAIGMMATYGLRNHEVFKCDVRELSHGDNVLTVTGGKTGHRIVWPLHPEWFEQFKLTEVYLPEVNLDRSNDRLGHSVTEFFSRVEAPFRAYDLRHAWAVRALDYGVEDAIAAKMMGHSTIVHCERYQRWINKKRFKSAMDRVLARDDRPLPPKI